MAALAKSNVPETLVKNKTALERYRTIKSDTSAMDGMVKKDDVEENVSLTEATTTTDEPIKKRRMKESDWNAPL